MQSYQKCQQYSTLVYTDPDMLLLTLKLYGFSKDAQCLFSRYLWRAYLIQETLIAGRLVFRACRQQICDNWSSWSEDPAAQNTIGS